MNLTVTGHHVDVTSSMRNYVNDKMERPAAALGEPVRHPRHPERREAPPEGRGHHRRRRHPALRRRDARGHVLGDRSADRQARPAADPPQGETEEPPPREGCRPDRRRRPGPGLTRDRPSHSASLGAHNASIADTSKARSPVASGPSCRTARRFPARMSIGPTRSARAGAHPLPLRHPQQEARAADGRGAARRVAPARGVPRRRGRPRGGERLERRVPVAVRATARGAGPEGARAPIRRRARPPKGGRVHDERRRAGHDRTRARRAAHPRREPRARGEARARRIEEARFEGGAEGRREAGRRTPRPPTARSPTWTSSTR